MFLQSLDVKRPTLAFAVGDSVILRSRDAGGSWQSVRVPGARTIAGALFVDANRWFVAGASSGGTNVVPVLRTDDGGVTWQRTVLPRRYPDGYGAVAFRFVDSRHGSLTVDTLHSGAFANVDLYVTGDGGQSWHFRASEPFTGPIMITGSRGWAVGGVGSEKLYSTSDGGKHWTPVPLPVPADVRRGTPTIGLPSVLGQASSGGLELALPAWYANGTGTSKTRNTVVVYSSSDGGRHWRATTPVYDPGFGNYTTDTLIPVAFTSRTQWSIGASVRMYVTDDAGQSWRSFQPDTRSSGLYGLIGAVQLAFPTSDVGFALIQYGHCREFKRGCTERSFVLRSEDNGKRWALLSLDGDPSAFPRCRASQLSASAAFGGATGSELGGVTLRNISRTTCSLPTRASVHFLMKGIFRNTVSPGAASFPQVPRRILRPGAAAYTALQWFNWCRSAPSPQGQITFELEIGGTQPVIAQAHDTAPPRCDAPRRPSLLWVGTFVEPPR